MAEQVGIKLGISFWTQPPHDGAGNSFYPSWAGNFTNIHSDPTVKAAWLEWVDYMTQQLNSPIVMYWQTLNEPYGSNRTSIEQLIVDTAHTIKKYASAPVSCRFILGWNPMTSRWSVDGQTYYDGSYFSASLMDELDFLSLTIYNDPTSDAFNTSSRATWETLRDSILNTHARGKPTFIVEFGNNSSDDETQRLHYERVINNRFIPYGLTAATAWSWQSRSPTSETWNICRGIANPRPAFYELEKAAQIPLPTCYVNADCPPGYICVNGACVLTAPAKGYLRVHVRG
jgi:hypothetical protein